jgi:hypothetical protein
MTTKTRPTDTPETIRTRREATRRLREGCLARLAEAQAAAGAIFLDGTDREKDAHRALLQDLQREDAECAAVLAELELRLAAAERARVDADLSRHGASYVALEDETKKARVKFDQAIGLAFTEANRMRVIRGKAQDIENAFEAAGRLDELRAMTTTGPGKTTRGGDMWAAVAVVLERAPFPRAVDDVQPYHTLEQYPASDR